MPKIKSNKGNKSLNIPGPLDVTKNKSGTNYGLIENQSQGVSKLKSQLRQAKRLLSKEGLDDQLRRSTLKKVEDLEFAIENHPSKEKERSNAMKYHAIKFFDRKKVGRRLNQVLREISEQNTTEETKIKKLTKERDRLRIDLNYVLHYPKHLKYVAIFPNGEYTEHRSKSTNLNNQIPSSKDPNQLRDYVRAYIHDSMENGKMSLTPEIQSVKTENQPQDAKAAEDLDEFFEA